MNRHLLSLLFASSAVVCSAQSFQNPRSIPVVDANPDAVSVTDLNNDGLPDLIVGVGNNPTSLQVEIFLADKSGNYSLASKINLPSGLSFSASLPT